MDVKWREEKVSVDSAASRDAQYNATVSCVASLTFKAQMATSLPLYVRSNDSQLDMLDCIIQTCKHSNSASEANSAAAMSYFPVLLVLEAACTDLLFP